MRRWRREEDRLGGLMWGLGLVVLGTVILIQYLGLMPFSWWHEWWPLVVVLVGVVQVVVARSPRKIGSGISTMLFGGWFFIATNHLWGLTWGNSWPLALVAAGVGMVARSILSGIMRREDEPTEVRNDG